MYVNFKGFVSIYPQKTSAKTSAKNHECLACQNQQTKVDSLPKTIGLCQKLKAVLTDLVESLPPPVYDFITTSISIKEFMSKIGRPISIDSSASELFK